MSKKDKKEKGVAVFNRSSRTFDLGETVIAPNTAAELDAKVAEKLLRQYPSELVEGDKILVSGGADSKRVKELEAEVADLKQKLESGDDSEVIEAKNTEIESLKSDLDKAHAAVEKLTKELEAATKPE